MTNRQFIGLMTPRRRHCTPVIRVLEDSCRHVSGNFFRTSDARAQQTPNAGPAQGDGASQRPQARRPVHPREPLGRFRRKHQEYYRLRAGDYRFYFQVISETLHIHYILHHNTLEDFLLRNKLPVTEQQLVEQNSKFWKYLETLAK